MILIFGKKEWRFEGQEIIGVGCPDCRQARHQAFGIQKYFHLYWIPVVPTSRWYGAVCQACTHILHAEHLRPDTRDEIRRDVFGPFRLLPFFSGSILLLLILGWFFNIV